MHQIGSVMRKYVQQAWQYCAAFVNAYWNLLA